MRPKENYTRYVVAGFVLTLAVLVSFQVYILREPARIASVEAQDQSIAVAAGQGLFKQNCTLCHGNNGEGDVGPALNDSTFLKTTTDDTIFSVISSGVPGTQMPAWNQAHGGPLTDENVTQLVAYLRSWQATAADIRSAPPKGDSGRGRTIFSNVCVVCHGSNGVGTDKAPALNDAQKLNQFDDAWYRDTIAQGRPAKGMPTWGSVLSPQQISDLIALIDVWRANPAPVAAITPTPSVTSTETTTATVEVARPSNPGGPGLAVDLSGNVQSGSQIFVDNCQKCHGPQGIGGVDNPGSDDSTIPPLNPIDETMVNVDPKVFAYNIDLFVEHGSTPSGPNPKQMMPAWGDDKKLTSQQIADVIAYVMSLNPITPVTSTTTITPAEVTTPTEEVARPSNPGGPGPALNLVGDVQAGTQLFTDNCQKCHGPQGAGGVDNPGSDDGTIPPLNPIDSTMVNADTKVFAYNVDLFVEHGSTPSGPNPKQTMPAWGDDKKLTPQQIADLIAYVMSLNPITSTAPITPTPTVTSTEVTTSTEEVARPSNPGGPGPAANLVGDVQAGTQLFTDNCQKCHGPQGTGGVDNPGSDDGTIPPLNPIDSTMVNADPKVFAYNVDLFVEHGSTPSGSNPKQTMPAWGDDKKLTPQQIADLIAYVMSLNPITSTESVTSTEVITPTEEVARPSNPGGPGAALSLVGNTSTGMNLFVDNCQKCHGPQGTGSVDNPGSDDGTIPPLNPIDSTMVNADLKTFAYNIDLFVEHGSTPSGSNPKQTMPAWGDDKKLTPQQIADLIAYVISLNLK